MSAKLVRLPGARVETGSEPEGGERTETGDLLEVLRRRIVTHELPPGRRLKENELAEEFGVSRARVRDAFRVLDERGLIERVPNRGAVVTRLEADRIQELFDVREYLEAAMVGFATRRAPPETWDRLLGVFGEDLGKAVAANDFDSYLAAIADFRATCIAAADNETLKDLLDSIYDRVQGMTRRLVLVPGRAMEGYGQHRDILLAMRAGDATRAEELKRANIRSARAWFDRFQKYLL